MWPKVKIFFGHFGLGLQSFLALWPMVETIFNNLAWGWRHVWWVANFIFLEINFTTDPTKQVCSQYPKSSPMIESTHGSHLQVWSLNPGPSCYQARAIQLTHHTRQRKETFPAPMPKTSFGCTSTYSKPLVNKPNFFLVLLINITNTWSQDKNQGLKVRIWHILDL
jgi:hypothetical protein